MHVSRAIRHRGGEPLARAVADVERLDVADLAVGLDEECGLRWRLDYRTLGRRDIVAAYRDWARLERDRGTFRGEWEDCAVAERTLTFADDGHAPSITSPHRGGRYSRFLPASLIAGAAEAAACP